MPYIQRDVAPGSQEDIEDRQNIVKRLTKLSELIPKEEDRETRAWLMQEEQFLRNAGRLVDWPAYKQRLKEIGREQKAITAKQEAARLAQEAAAKAADDAIRAKLQAKLDEETDPVTLYRRANSQRTF